MALRYDEAIDYLYSLINYELQRPARYTPDVVSLERPRALMAALGDPQEHYSIIHVTGTKGKGSVSAMTANVLQAAGLKVGLYSSPHLQDFRERFRINGEMIPHEKLAALIEQIKAVVESMPGLTWFEVTTAIAFEYFAQESVDLAVIEVGLGGRLDATNVVQHPLVTTITSLSYDHIHLLGNTLMEIAFEKAGIIKPGAPVVSAPQHAEALEVLERTAAMRGSPLTLVGRDWQVIPGVTDVNGQSFQARKLIFPLSDSSSLPVERRLGGEANAFWIPLIGQHQVINATVALATLDHVRAAGFSISDEAIHAGLRSVNWPGRLEIVQRDPWMILDVAHNAESATRLVEALTTVFPNQKWTLIFGAFTDKDLDGMFRALLPITENLILMKALNPRAFDTEELADKAHAMGFSGHIEAIPAAEHALARARELAGTHGHIAVTGSLSIVGEMRDILGLQPLRAAYLDNETVQALQSAAQG